MFHRFALSLLLLLFFSAGHANEWPIDREIDVPALRLYAPLPEIRTSGQPNLKQLEGLKALGLVGVVNLRPRDEAPGQNLTHIWAPQLDLQYWEIAVSSPADFTEQNAKTLWSLVSSAQAENRPTLIHCASGNRVGALLAIAAHKAGGMPVGEALSLGDRAGLSSLRPLVKEFLEQAMVLRGLK